jgi:ankyrin repeat protein
VFAKEALVVGVKSYENSPLRNTLNDAKDVAKKLKAMGFRVQLSLDPEMKDFDEAQDAFEKRLGPGVLALVYFSGHGCEFEGDSYLFMKETPDGVDERRLDRTAVRLGRIRDGLNGRKTAFNVYILDACRSVRVTRNFREAVTGGLAQINAPSVLTDAGEVIAYATAPRETASDSSGVPGGRNGFYTHYLLQYLAEEIPVRDMLELVSFAIMDKTGGKQRPWVNSWMGSRRAQQVQLVGVGQGSSGADIVEREIAAAAEIRESESESESEWESESESESESNPNKVQNLFDAAKHGNVALIKRLVDAGADVNAVNEDTVYKGTALHEAAYHDKVAAIRCLVNECNANVEAGDKNGVTPLSNAARNDSVAAIRCLVKECKANVEAGDKDGRTALHWAAIFNSVAAIQCLVKECKANVEASDKYGSTPLHYAAWRDNVAAIRCLVKECKANVEASDKDGETPLHYAAWRDNVAAIRCLVNKCNANVEAVDKRGRTPLERAKETKRVLRKLSAKT